MSNIAVIVPTIRENSYNDFIKAWKPLFDFHEVELIVVWDGDDQHIKYNDKRIERHEVLKTHEHLVQKRTPACRNLGFAYVAKHLSSVEYIITLDDDVRPNGDTIGDHLYALSQRVPTSYMGSTIIYSTWDYMRGFPHNVREESEVVLSHGVWNIVPDYDAPTQLLVPFDHFPVFYRGPIPKGVQTNLCGMNIAFKRKALPYVYYAPVAEFKGAQRFDDIWGFYKTKLDFDERNWAIMTGIAEVDHIRASDVWKNLEQEVVGMRLNEDYWKGEKTHEWFDQYELMRQEWTEWMLNGH